MDERRKSSLLWGLVGMMAYLALAQGYNLLAEQFLGLGPMAVGAVVVFVATTVVSHVLQPRLPNESP